MRILVSGSTRAVAALAPAWPRHLGILLTPGNYNSVASVVATGLPWGIDNGAYSGFDEEKFRRLLARAAGQPRLLWVVAPDVVGDARATLARFREWHPEFRAAGVPVALVGQNGAEAETVPWDDFECFFVGGCPECRACGYVLPGARPGERCPKCRRRLREWKLSPSSAVLCAEAKRRGKQLHMGRVNSLRRLRVAHDRGCDSVDGSGYSRFAAVARLKRRNDMLLERHLRYLAELEGSPTLFA